MLPNIHTSLFPNFKFYSYLKNGMKQLFDPRRSLNENPSKYSYSYGILKSNSLHVPFTKSYKDTLKSYFCLFADFLYS